MQWCWSSFLTSYNEFSQNNARHKFKAYRLVTTCYVGSISASLSSWQLTSEWQCTSKGRVTGYKHVLNNYYWMRLGMISWIIKTEVCVICQSRRLRQITQTQGFDNSWYHVKTEFNNCFITHFSHNSSSETAKLSAILFLRRTLQGA